MENNHLHPKPRVPEGDEVIEFGPFRLQVAGRLLQRNGVAVKLGSRSLDILIALGERAGGVSRRPAFHGSDGSKRGTGDADG